MDNSRKVDTLSLAERISVRTNLLDWGLTVPNIGVEFDLRSTNWNRYAVNVNLRYRPRTEGTYVRPIIFDLLEVTAEGRMYWRERRAERNGYLKRHRFWFDKLFSCRTMMPSHPNWIFYRGGYLSYSKYSMLFGGNATGRQGSAVFAGFTWGFVKPFLAFQNGNSIDMEFGISAGLCYNNYDTYKQDEINNCYPKTGHEDWHLEKFPVVKDLHAAIVYRFGNYPIQKKYRWRYDVDMDFRNKKDSIYNAWLTAREQKYIRDSIYRVVSKEFRLLYDSCVDEKHKLEQQEIDKKSPKRLTQDSIRLRKQQIRDSIAHRKDSIATVKALKAGRKAPAQIHTLQAEKKKKAENAAAKQRDKAQQNALKAKQNAAKRKAGGKKNEADSKSNAALKEPEADNSSGGSAPEDDSPQMSDKERKKAEQKARAERAKANAAKAKARRDAAKAAKNSKSNNDSTKGGDE